MLVFWSILDLDHFDVRIGKMQSVVNNAPRIAFDSGSIFQRPVPRWARRALRPRNLLKRWVPLVSGTWTLPTASVEALSIEPTKGLSGPHTPDAIVSDPLSCHSEDGTNSILVPQVSSGPADTLDKVNVIADFVEKALFDILPTKSVKVGSHIDAHGIRVVEKS